MLVPLSALWLLTRCDLCISLALLQFLAFDFSVVKAMLGALQKDTEVTSWGQLLLC